MFKCQGQAGSILGFDREAETDLFAPHNLYRFGIEELTIHCQGCRGGNCVAPKVLTRCERLNLIGTLRVAFGRKGCDSQVLDITGTHRDVLGFQVPQIEFCHGLKAAITEDQQVCGFGVSDLDIFDIGNIAGTAWICQTIGRLERAKDIGAVIGNGDPGKRLPQS